jgi:hypothetical protein
MGVGRGEWIEGIIIDDQIHWRKFSRHDTSGGGGPERERDAITLYTLPFPF